MRSSISASKRPARRCLAAAIAVALGATASSSADAALVVAYDFENGSGNALDLATADGANNGTLSSGATYVTGGAPNNGGNYSVNFDGTANGVIRIGSPGGVVQNVSGATLAAWVNPASFPASGGTRGVLFFSNSTASGQGARASLALQAGGQIRGAGRTADGDAFTSFTTTGTAPLTVDTWTHIATVLDFANRTITMYANGVQIGQQSVAPTAWSATSTANTAGVSAGVGARTGATADELFIGRIDNPQVYNTALSASEVAALVPEPASAGLMGVVAAAGLLARRRGRAAR